MGALGAPLPSSVDHAMRRSVTLARGGSDAFVFLPLDARGRPWARAPRPLAIDAQSDPGG
jgi:hypothetical protein